MVYRKKSEATEQERVMRWAAIGSITVPELELLHHIPNGGSRNQLEAANLKRQGVKAGVPGSVSASPGRRLSWTIHRNEVRKEQADGKTTMVAGAVGKTRL